MKKIGELLVQHGLMSDDQVRQVLAAQKDDPAPFGYLAQKMFDIDAQAIWRCWGRQMAECLPVVDLGSLASSQEALSEISASVAWRHRALPIALHERTITLATSPERLPAVMAWAHTQLAYVIDMVLVDDDLLEQAIPERYARYGESFQAA